MSRSGGALRALAVVLTVGLAAASASATPGAAEREARHRFDEGEALYRAGHYAEALARYQSGYQADPLAGFLINIAQCQRRLGDLKAARATYRKFVLVAPDSRLVPEVETLLKQLDDLIADLPATGGAGDAAADVHETDLSGETPAAAPQPPSLVPPVPAAEASLLATPAPTADAAPPRRSHARWWIWGGVAVAAIAGGVVTAVALSSPATTTVRAGSLGTLSR